MSLDELSLDRIEKRILKENYLFAPIFKDGIIPLRILGREQFFYYYDPAAEGTWTTGVPASTSSDGVTNLGWQAPVRFGSNKLPGNPSNVFGFTDSAKFIQLFYGLEPRDIKVLTNMPAEKGQKNMPMFVWTTSYNQFGFVDGLNSPFKRPAPDSETLIPPSIDVAFGVAHPLPFVVYPIFAFVVNVLRVEVVRDPGIVAAMLLRKTDPETIYRTIGGLADFAFPYRNVYDCDAIPLGAKADVISAALRRSSR